MDKELAAPVKRHLIMRPKTTGGGGRPLVVVPTIGAAYRPSALMPVKPLSACRTASGGTVPGGRTEILQVAGLLFQRTWPSVRSTAPPSIRKRCPCLLV